MKPKSTPKSNTIAKAIQTACEIHIRTLDLAANWTAFDPFGAVVDGDDKAVYIAENI